MKDLSVVVYTMKGCPFCTDFKEMLVNEGIEFFDRDIEEYEEEYNLFVEVTENEFVPAFMLIESPPILIKLIDGFMLLIAIFSNRSYPLDNSCLPMKAIVNVLIFFVSTFL